ncbi:hypothetical protein KKG31_05680 [Patescibacteria group bacterium]|nr:hypothetical protein [Patescibacteria group bacterium]MBU1758595.1 hypothetical protein [Patescibacteria group bacterium]
METQTKVDFYIDPNGQYKLSEEFINENNISEYRFLGAVLVFEKFTEGDSLSKEAIPIVRESKDYIEFSYINDFGEGNITCTWFENYFGRVFIGPSRCVATCKQGDEEYVRSIVWIDKNFKSLSESVSYCDTKGFNNVIFEESRTLIKKDDAVLAMLYIDDITGRIMQIGDFPTPTKDIIQKDARVFVRTDFDGNEYLSFGHSNDHNCFHSNIPGPFKGSYQYCLLLNDDELYLVDQNEKFYQTIMHLAHSLKQLIEKRLYLTLNHLIFLVGGKIHTIEMKDVMQYQDIAYADLNEKIIDIYGFSDSEPYVSYDISEGTPRKL